jgi:hypothetical protein
VHAAKGGLGRTSLHHRERALFEEIQVHHKCAMKGTKVLEFSSFHRAKCPAAVKTAHVGATGKQGTMDVSGNSKYNVKREYTLSGREVL